MQTTSGPQPAARPGPSIRRRLIAMVYEAMLVFAIAFFAGLPFAGTEAMAAGGWERHAFQGYLFVVIGAYFILSWRRGGQTLAMKTWKLRVARADGGEITLRQAMVRYACAWPSVLFFGLGILYAILDRDRLFLHDRLAGTRIAAA